MQKDMNWFVRTEVRTNRLWTKYTYHPVDVSYTNPVFCCVIIFVCCHPLRVVFSWFEMNICSIQTHWWNIFNPATIHYIQWMQTHLSLSKTKCSCEKYFTPSNATHLYSLLCVKYNNRTSFQQHKDIIRLNSRSPVPILSSTLLNALVLWTQE